MCPARSRARFDFMLKENFVILGIGAAGIAPGEPEVQRFLKFLDAVNSPASLCMVMCGASAALQRQLLEAVAPDAGKFLIEFPKSRHTSLGASRLILIPPGQTARFQSDDKISISDPLPGEGIVDSFLISLGNQVNSKAIALLLNARTTDEFPGLPTVTSHLGLTLLESVDEASQWIEGEDLAGGAVEHEAAIERAAHLINRDARFLKTQSRLRQEGIHHQLERELASTRADLEKSVQDLEFANQELRSATEELILMKEALQKANEELKSSKDEILSAHRALDEAKSELESLFQSASIAMIYVDEEIRVRAFTLAATQIYNLIDADIGRPLRHLTHRLVNHPEISSFDALAPAGSTDVIVKTIGGRVYRRRVVPSLDCQSGAAKGWIITFSDITDSLLSEHLARGALEAGQMGTWQWNLDDKTLNCDQTTRDLLNVSDNLTTCSSELAFKNIVSEDLAKLNQDVENAKAHRTRFRCDCRIRDPHQSYRWVAMVGGLDPFIENSLTGVAFDVNPVSSVREKLVASEAFTRTIFENSPVCVKVLDRDGRLVSINQIGCQWLELADAASVRGKYWWEIWPAASRELIRQSFRASLKGKTVHLQVECPTTPGNSRWCDMAIVGVPNQEGRITQVIAMGRDITSDKLAELANLEGAEKLRAALEVAEIGIAMIDYEKNLVQFDKIAARIMDVEYGVNMSRDEFHRQFHPEDRMTIQDLSVRAFDFAGERGFFVEARIPRDSGTTWVNLRKQNFFSSDGALQKGLVAIQDTTDLRAAEAQLREQHERLRYTLAATKAGIWDWHVRENYIIWSEETFVLYGLEPETDGAVSFDRWLALVEPRDRQQVLDSLDALIKEGKSDWVCEYRVHLPDEREKWLQGRGRMEYDEQGNALRMSGIDFDLTERKEFELELQHARDVAEAATRTRGEFLANMSHEIRTPMTAILGHADILVDQLTVPDDLQSLEIIRRNGRHLLEIINDILDLSKIDAGHLDFTVKQIRPDELIGDIHSLMDLRAAEKGLDLSFHFISHVPRIIETDPVRVRQILLNLIGNAIKFTPAGQIQVTIAYRRESGQMEFVVADTGIGIDVQKRERLFTPFTQADSSTTRQFGGTGLGLAISRRLARALGGDITVESEIGRGSKFTFTLGCGCGSSKELILPEVSLAMQNLLNQPHAYPKIDASVLIVDDRRDIRLLGQHFVEKAGGRVTSAADGQAAVDLLLSPEGEHIDIVLMDMQMPVMDGYVAVRTLRQQGYTNPIIALTANAMKEDRERCLAAGCDDYTAKPIDGRTLVQLIARLLQTAEKASE
jgi:PAS domain S-box-containing protein